jgi:hypothetical protein
MTARYNGLADWYDTRFGDGAEANRQDLVDLLGPGDGMRHVPLADFLNAFIRAGLLLERVVEPRQDPVPHAIAVRARLSRC